MELLLIRHALPLRVERRDGAPADPPLAPRGRDQAARLAAWLAEEGLDAVYTSPLRRARETADPLARGVGVTPRVEPRVVELDHQSSTYVPLEELKATDYPRWQALVQRGGLYAGVDLPSFRRAVVEALEACIAAHPGGRVAVVCHGGVINAWAGHVLGVEDPLFIDAAYTSVSRFLAASTGERSVQSLNETAHLRGGAAR